ncbi:hypothetical protein [Lentibacillus halophilus]|uniref:hypothetical protein n=1 Tax=Lentibacillus halophilus TaxID=295065 RepID=UPI0031DFA505
MRRFGAARDKNRNDTHHAGRSSITINGISAAKSIESEAESIGSWAQNDREHGMILNSCSPR